MRIPTPHSDGTQWPARPARSLFVRQRREPRESDGTVTAFRDGDVTLRSNRREEGFTNAIREHGYQGVRRGDLVIHSMDGFAGAIGVSDSDGKVSPVVHCYQPTAGVDARFFAYLLRDLALGGFVTSLAKGIRERSTAFDVETFRSLVLPVPPVDEQRAIADYLDAETARLDELIAKKQRMIELLGDRKWASIDKVLGADAQGSELGPIAALCQLVIDCVNKTAPTSDQETPYKMIRTSNVRDGRVDTKDVFCVSEETYRVWTRRSTPLRDDVLLTREAPVGEVGLVETDERIFLGQRLMMYRADRETSLPKYLLYSLMSSQVRRQFDLLGEGSLHSHLRVGDCAKLKVPLLPLESQRAAVAILDRIIGKANSAIDGLGRQIDLLGEHRRALITSAVAGELDVPA